MNKWKKQQKIADKEILDATDKLLRNEVTVDVWRGEIQDILYDLHTDSASYGKELAIGKIEKFTSADMLTIERNFLLHIEYLQKFADDIAEKYTDEDGGYNKAGILNRIVRYTPNTRSTGNFVWLDYQEDDIFWIVTAYESCSDCPYLQARSPYKPGELYTVPGGFDTDCGGSCKCYLRNKNGKTSIKP